MKWDLNHHRKLEKWDDLKSNFRETGGFLLNFGDVFSGWGILIWQCQAPDGNAWKMMMQLGKTWNL